MPNSERFLKSIKDLEENLQPIDVWYQKFLRTMKRYFSEDWHKMVDEAPQEVRDSMLVVHQAALMEWWKKHRPDSWAHFVERCK